MLLAREMIPGTRLKSFNLGKVGEDLCGSHSQCVCGNNRTHTTTYEQCGKFNLPDAACTQVTRDDAAGLKSFDLEAKSSGPLRMLLSVVVPEITT